MGSNRVGLPRWDCSQQSGRKQYLRDWVLLLGVFALGALWLSWPLIKESQAAYGNSKGCHGLRKVPGIPLRSIPSHLQSFQDCSISNFQANLSFLDTAHPLTVSEFAHRRDRLAQALESDGLDAFVVEPGYTFSYYGNVRMSQARPSTHQMLMYSRSPSQIGRFGSQRSGHSLW